MYEIVVLVCFGEQVMEEVASIEEAQAKIKSYERRGLRAYYRAMRLAA